MIFGAGDKVQHVLNKEFLMVLEHDQERNRYICRRKSNLDALFFYAFEIERVPDVGA